MPIFYFLWELHRRYPDPLSLPRVAEATRRAQPTLYHYFHGRYRDLRGYVALALALFGLLRQAGAIDAAGHADLLRRLRRLTADALIEGAGLKPLFDAAAKGLDNAESVHLLLRDVAGPATD